MALYKKQIEKVAEIYNGFPKLENSRILVTGATGMLGICMIDILMYCKHKYNRHMEIIAVGRDEVKAQKRLHRWWLEPDFHFQQCDVNNLSEVLLNKTQKVKIDYIIHGASNTHPVAYAQQPIETIMTNVLGTRNVLECAALQEKCRTVFLSSVEVYGENIGSEEKFAEQALGYIDCNTLRAGYPEAKRCGEALCQAYRREKGLDVVIPRLSRVYGPTMQQEDSKAIAQFIKRAVAHQDIILKSAGTQKYSYIYVADCASAILYIMGLGEDGEAYNVAGKDSDLTLKELAEYLAVQSNVSVVMRLPEEVERQGYSQASKAMLDTSKLNRLGWNSIWDMRTGLRDTLNIMWEELGFKTSGSL